MLPCLKSMSGARVTSITGHDAAGCYALASTVGARVHPTVTALIADPEVDVVYIATPPGTHASIAIEVARAGKPCVIETVMARTGEEARVIVEEFQRLHLPVYVNQARRFHVRIMALRHLLSSNQIGSIVSLNYTLATHLSSTHLASGWRTSAELAGGGPIVEYATELFDIVSFLFGTITQVNGDASHRVDVFNSIASSSSAPSSSTLQPIETQASCTFRCIDGANQPINCSANFSILGRTSGPSSSHLIDTLQFVGTNGAITMPLFSDELPQVNIRGTPHRIQLPTSAPSSTTLSSPFLQHVTSELRLWRSGAISSSNSSNISSSNSSLPHFASVSSLDGLRISHCVDSLLRSYYRQRSDSFWIRPETWKHNRETETIVGNKEK